MIKRIQCRVISSKPFVSRGEDSPHINKLNRPHHRIDSDSAGYTQVNNCRNVLTYSCSSDIAKGSDGFKPIGQVLDCYA
jgi:hypothetical protein